MSREPRNIHTEVTKLISDYEIAMSVFDGEPCANCREPLDHKQSNYFPVWSDEYDNLLCTVCYESLKGNGDE